MNQLIRPTITRRVFTTVNKKSNNKRIMEIPITRNNHQPNNHQPKCRYEELVIQNKEVINSLKNVNKSLCSIDKQCKKNGVGIWFAVGSVAGGMIGIQAAQWKHYQLSFQ